MAEAPLILTALAAVAAVVASIFGSNRDRLHATSSQNLKLFLDENPAPVFLVDAKGRPTYQNRAAVAVYGDRIGQDFREWTHPDDLKADVPLWEGLVRGEYSSYQICKRHVRPEIALRGEIPNPRNPDHWWPGILSVTLWRRGKARSVGDALLRVGEFVQNRGDVAVFEACGAILPVRADAVERCPAAAWGEEVILDHVSYRQLFAPPPKRESREKRTSTT